jgi:hypothetical protein
VVEGCILIFWVYYQINCFLKNSLLLLFFLFLLAGIHRFDFLQELDGNHLGTNRFKLIEIFNSESATAKHKLSEHYQAWAKGVAGLMKSPRSAAKYNTIYPSPVNFHKSSQLVYPGNIF